MVERPQRYEYKYSPPLGLFKGEGQQTIVPDDEGIRIVVDGVVARWIQYSDIKSIRLEHTPRKHVWNSYCCIVELHSSKDLKIFSESCETLGFLPKDRGTEYSAFLMELHRKVQSKNPNVIYHAGYKMDDWMLYLSIISFVFIGSTFAAAIWAKELLMLCLVFGAPWGLFFGISAVKNRPSLYDPKLIPSRILPKQAKKLRAHVPRVETRGKDDRWSSP